MVLPVTAVRIPLIGERDPAKTDACGPAEQRFLDTIWFDAISRLPECRLILDMGVAGCSRGNRALPRSIYDLPPLTMAFVQPRVARNGCLVPSARE